jgi:hypothetical protein
MKALINVQLCVEDIHTLLATVEDCSAKRHVHVLQAVESCQLQERVATEDSQIRDDRLFRTVENSMERNRTQFEGITELISMVRSQQGAATSSTEQRDLLLRQTIQMIGDEQLLAIQQVRDTLRMQAHVSTPTSARSVYEYEDGAS